MSISVEQIAPKTWLLTEDPGSGATVYMYLLEGSREALLIDTGYGSGPLDEIVKELTSLPVTVLLTHGHLDHIGGTAWFDRVLLHEKDLDCYRLHSTVRERELFGLDPSLPFPKETPELIDERWETDLGDRPVRLICTPGHTEGCVCVLDTIHRMLFSGDVCCKGNVLLNMKYACPIEVHEQSLERLLEFRASYDFLWPGHHEKPLGPEIVEQFLALTKRLLRGEAKGDPLEVAGALALELKEGDIGILYSMDGVPSVL